MRRSDTVRVGFFGKLPSRGDFVRVGLSRELTAAWDGWLRTVMPPARKALGVRWPEAWSNTPPWRFACAAGLCGPHPTTGIWLPSRDSVGRDFPLLVAAEPAAASPPFLDAVEPIARRAIRAGAAPEHLRDRLAGLPPPASDAGTDALPMRWWTGADEGSGQGPGQSFDGSTWPDLDMFLRMLAS